MVRERPKSLADVERNISFLRRRIGEARRTASRRGIAKRAAIPKIEEEITRLRAGVRAGRISPISSRALAAVNVGRRDDRDRSRAPPTRTLRAERLARERGEPRTAERLRRERLGQAAAILPRERRMDRRVIQPTDLPTRQQLQREGITGRTAARFRARALLGAREDPRTQLARAVSERIAREPRRLQPGRLETRVTTLAREPITRPERLEAIRRPALRPPVPGREELRASSERIFGIRRGTFGQPIPIEPPRPAEQPRRVLREAAPPATLTERLSRRAELAEIQAARARARGESPILPGLTAFGLGVGAGAIGLGAAILSPIETAIGFGRAVTSPLQTGAAFGAQLATRPAFTAGQVTAGVGGPTLAARAITPIVRAARMLSLNKTSTQSCSSS